MVDSRKRKIMMLISLAVCVLLVKYMYEERNNQMAAVTYAGGNNLNYEIQCETLDSKYKCEVNDKQQNIEENNSDFLVINWDETNETMTKLADIIDADIYQPKVSESYKKIYDNIDVSNYSTLFVNLGRGSENGVKILKQLAEEYNLSNKTIIPIYDSVVIPSEEIGELESIMRDSVWLTGGVLDRYSTDEDIENWVRGLGMYIVEDEEVCQ